jgi:cell wall assembly regulator SMI1
MSAPSTASDLAGQFSRVRALIQTLLPDVAPFLPGARHEDIERLGSTLGFPVPPELVELLHICGGQDDPQELAGPINYQHFLTVDEIISMHLMLSDAVGEMAEPADQPSPYRWTVWSPRWVPFMAFNGDAFCVDTDPGDAGSVGQVFYRPNAPDLGAPLARSLGAFFARIADLIETGAADVKGTTLGIIELYGG